jgi:uncharacterized protein (UPF0276 family)
MVKSTGDNFPDGGGALEHQQRHRGEDVPLQAHGVLLQ